MAKQLYRILFSTLSSLNLVIGCDFTTTFAANYTKIATSLTGFVTSYSDLDNSYRTMTVPHK